VRLLLDQNLPSRLLRDLDSAFPGSAHARDIGMARASDLEVWEYAFRQQLAIVTKDLDFRDIVALRGFPPKIILIRWGNISNDALVSRFVANLELTRAFLEDKENGLLEVW